VTNDLSPLPLPERLVIAYDDDAPLRDAAIADMRTSFQGLLADWPVDVVAPRLVLEDHRDDRVVSAALAVELFLPPAASDARAAALRVLTWAKAQCDSQRIEWICELDDDMVGDLRPGRALDDSLLDALAF
jgi:hypothetical protein